MPAKNPRINAVLDPPLFKYVQFLAEKDGVSLSTKVRDLLKDAMEIGQHGHNDGKEYDRQENRDETVSVENLDDAGHQG